MPFTSLLALATFRPITPLAAPLAAALAGLGLGDCFAPSGLRCLLLAALLSALAAFTTLAALTSRLLSAPRCLGLVTASAVLVATALLFLAPAALGPRALPLRTALLARPGLDRLGLLFGLARQPAKDLLQDRRLGWLGW